MDLSSSQSDGGDGDVERIAAAQNTHAVAQESTGAVGEKVDAAEGSDGGAELGAGLDTSGLGTEEGAVPETNHVGSGAEMSAASHGSSAGAEVGSAPEANIVGAGEGVAVAAAPQMQGDGFYCHQCRQPREGASLACKGSFKKRGKCPLKYCMSCVRNRYSEIADEVLQEEAWEFPNCRNFCNCSEEQRGGADRANGLSWRKRKGSVDDTPSTKKPLARAANTDALEDDIDLPRGTLMTCDAGIELQPEDVGPSIQFLEFCRLFGKIFAIREGQPELTVKEITGGCELQDVPSVVADIHISLLSIIEKGKDKACEYPKHGDEWIRKVGEYIADSTLGTKDLTLNLISAYKNLTPSCKLDVLNCLCDKALSSELIREKIRAATEKEKLPKKGHKDLSKPMKAREAASNEKTEIIISQIKDANAMKQSEKDELEELGRVLKTAPIRLDKGVAYWKLDGYCSNNTNVMRQEFDDENTVKNNDKWFMFTEEEQKVIKDHLAKRSRRPSINQKRA